MRKPKPKKENSERWLLTYSDLITLLMILFVVMYTMSSVDQEKYSKAAESFKGVFSGSTYVIGEGGGIGPLPNGITQPSDEVANNSETPTQGISDTAALQEKIQGYLKNCTPKQMTNNNVIIGENVDLSATWQGVTDISILNE